MRESLENDEKMKKICALYQPIPMDRLDLLPTPVANTSGFYSRPLKNPRILQRPSTAMTMVKAVDNLTGRKIGDDYMTSFNKTVEALRIMRYAENDLDVFAQQTYQPLNSFPKISEILYQDIDGWEAFIMGDACPDFQKLIDSGYLQSQNVSPTPPPNTPSVASGYEPYEEEPKMEIPETPMTPRPRQSAQNLAIEEAYSDPATAARALTAPDYITLRNRAIRRNVARADDPRLTV